MGFGALAAADLLADTAATARADAPPVDWSQPLAPRHADSRARAKAVIWIVLNGGPSQVDTWDYKPELQKRDGQPLQGADLNTGFFETSGKLLKSPFRFSQHGDSGSWSAEIFPHLARQIDEMAFVHSCCAESNNHAPALFQLNTGLSRMGFPSVGSWVTYGLGSENENLPWLRRHDRCQGAGTAQGRSSELGRGVSTGRFSGGTPQRRRSANRQSSVGRAGQSAAHQRALLDVLQTGSIIRHHQRYAGGT